MFAIEVEYLTGRAVATERHKREEAEWPPHPGRLYSALVDAAFQAVSADGETLPPDIRAALEWLERLDAPSVSVSDAQRRDVLQSFVPVNDAAAPEVKANRIPSAGQIKDALAVLPDHRGRQPRYFPTVIPDSPLVHFVWEDAPDAETHRPAFDRLAACVPYLGHSSSLVRVAVTDAPEPATYRPDPHGQHQLRVPAPGRLADLVAHYRRQSRPSAGRYVAYSKILAGKMVPVVRDGSAFGDIIVCEIDGPFLPLSGAVKFLNAVRDAVIRATDGESQDIKTLVSGHTADGGVSHENHVAYIPLANIGHHHADGKVMGFGLALPRGLARFSEQRRKIMKAITSIAYDKAIGFEGHEKREWKVGLVGPENTKKSLSNGPYTGEADQWKRWDERTNVWATVTPILCDRFPKDKDGERVEDIIAQSVERVVGVRPVGVETGHVSRHLGVPPSHEFHTRRKPDGPARHRVHAVIEFAEPVRGPLIVGAGRYYGLGLFRIWEPEGRR